MRVLRQIVPLSLLIVLFLLPLNVHAQWRPLNPVTSVEQQSDGALLTMKTGELRVRVCTDSIFQVIYSPTASFPDSPSYMVTKTSWPAPQWTLQTTDKNVVLATSRMKVTIWREDGRILFSDALGKR